MTGATVEVPPGLPAVGDGGPQARRFVGRTCVVTGAASGIGRAAALRLAAEGARIAAVDLDPAGARETLALAGGAGVALAVDLRSTASVEACLAAALAALGGLDVLVNNAGIEILGTVAETTPEIWDEVMAVNLRGTYLMSRATLPALLDSAGRNGEAAIVNNASLMGLVSSARLAAYCASKAGVVSLTRSMALDHADRHLRVNCVCPGIVHTPMLERRFALEPDRAAAYRRTTERPPVKYLGRPEDVAAMIAYLASTEARFVTGASFTIDGGRRRLMTRYIVGRLLQIVPVIVGISIAVFLLVRLIPGDPATAMLGSRATAELIARVHDQFGLDLPLWRQYLNYVGHALQGDFGVSFFYQTGVWEVTIERLPTTLLLMGSSILLSVILAVPFAVIAAVRRGGAADQAIRLVFTAVLGMPAFWSGIVLAVLLGARLRLLPTSGLGEGGLETVRHLILPSLTIALALSPILVRTLRSSLIEVIGSDYVMTGTAMGLRRSTLLVSYLLRNSLRPVVSIISINVGYLIGGTVIVEQIFSLPGMGSLLIGSIGTRDYAIIQLATLIFALLVIAVNLVADLLYSLLDPRISLAR